VTVWSGCYVFGCSTPLDQVENVENTSNFLDEPSLVFLTPLCMAHRKTPPPGLVIGDWATEDDFAKSALAATRSVVSERVAERAFLYWGRSAESLGIVARSGHMCPGESAPSPQALSAFIEKAISDKGPATGMNLTKDGPGITSITVPIFDGISLRGIAHFDNGPGTRMFSSEDVDKIWDLLGGST